MTLNVSSAILHVLKLHFLLRDMRFSLRLQEDLTIDMTVTKYGTVMSQNSVICNKGDLLSY